VHPEHASKNIPLSPPIHCLILIKQVSTTQSLSISHLFDLFPSESQRKTQSISTLRKSYVFEDFQAAVVQHRFNVHKKTSERWQKNLQKIQKKSPFVKHYTITTTLYGSTNKSRTYSFLKVFNKFKSVFMTMSAIHIKSVTAALRWIWEGRNLKENNTIKVCLKRQVPIDPFALFFNTLWT